MKIGTSVVGEITMFRVTIEGRGGDSVHDEWFETADAAVLASAIDGGNDAAHPEVVLRLSDGTHILPPRTIHISTPPTIGAVAKLLDNLSPATRALLRRAGAKV